MTEIVQNIHILLNEIAGCINPKIEHNYFSVKSIADNLEQSKKGNLISFYCLKEEYESFLFKQMFSSTLPTSFFHYTSFNAIFEIIRTGKIQISSLVGLNDKFEPDLVNKFLDINSGHLMTTLNANLHFIMSFSRNADDLNQWRLYGENGEGVMLEFKIIDKLILGNNFYIAKVLYELKLFEIYKKYRILFNNEYKFDFGLKYLNYWKFFFKHKDYKDEREVRLLIKNEDTNFPNRYHSIIKINRYGILSPYIEFDLYSNKSTNPFPLELKSITLGPKLKERETNRIQLENYWLDRYPNDPSIYNVKQSEILHYR